MNKTVVITGASKGIGAATARKFAKESYNVVVNFLHSLKEAQNLKLELEEKYQIKCLLVQADISKEEEVKRLLEETLLNFKRIDCLVNNAALAIDNEPECKTVEEFQSVLNTNVIGTFLTCKYFGMQMKKNGYGKIINISSTNAIDTFNTYSMDYDASKSGVISLTHNFAKLLAPEVTVNTVAPGWTNTESVLEMNPNLIKEEKEKILLKRFAEPEEIANIIYFLASKEANYINNAVIRCDGGIFK